MNTCVLAILLIVPVAVYAATETVCEGKEVRLKCKEGTIKIQSALYGRQSKKPCKDANANNINCSSGKAEAKVKKHCEGKAHCNLEAISSNFGGDPCPGTSKYLEVKWKCQA